MPSVIWAFVQNDIEEELAPLECTEVRIGIVKCGRVDDVIDKNATFINYSE